VSEDGALWSFENQQLVQRGSFEGARAVAVSPDGENVVLVGDNMIARSSDGGHTWTPIALPESIRFDDVRLDDDGNAVAVGSAGALARIDTNGRVAVQRLGSVDLHAVHIAGYRSDAEGHGFAAGEPGTIWMTRDGGKTWSAGPEVTEAVYGLDIIGTGHR
jgi:photosystem II stability/assembly factor-like uncharacterized protein